MSIHGGDSVHNELFDADPATLSRAELVDLRDKLAAEAALLEAEIRICRSESTHQTTIEWPASA